MKILLAVDGSPYTKKMLAYLTAHDEMFGAQHDYTLFTVTDIPPVPPGIPIPENKASEARRCAEAAEKVLAPISKFLLKSGIDAQSAHKTGHVGKMIAEFAEKGKFDMVVMGSHGHGNLGNLVMGSVATKVLAMCKVPVMLVR